MYTKGVIASHATINPVNAAKKKENDHKISNIF